MNKTDSQAQIKHRIHEIIFEADTPAGKAFDVTLLILIILSVIVVMVESVETFSQQYPQVFFILEWTLTILFTIEYLLRIYSIGKPWKYMTSFYGVVETLRASSKYEHPLH